MSRCYGYIRVSTTKQGEGVSLPEQRSAIEHYAQLQGITIIDWFEEKQTAAKRGRPEFTRMLLALRSRKADGVIIHKIDRSARNLRDWADLGELIDRGIAVHFVNESIDLHTRGGRLSADIQAVVASDYIRNLREETRKGFYGRLKQGFYPLPAPLGYIDEGKARPKRPDPERAPLIKLAFDLYSTGQYSLLTLADNLYEAGLRTRRGAKVSKNTLGPLLANPFYIGVIRLRRTRETFTGVHEPLVSTAIFERVQDILQGKRVAYQIRHNFLFRRMLTCRSCHYSLIGEQQKGHVYYRCHTRGCPTRSFREEFIDTAIIDAFTQLKLPSEQIEVLHRKADELRRNWALERQHQIHVIRTEIEDIENRLSRLTDAYVDRLIDADTFQERREKLLIQRQATKEKLSHIEDGGSYIPDKIGKFLELISSLYITYKLALADKRRELLKQVTSNLFVFEKNVE